MNPTARLLSPTQQKPGRQSVRDSVVVCIPGSKNNSNGGMPGTLDSQSDKHDAEESGFYDIENDNARLLQSRLQIADN